MRRLLFLRHARAEPMSADDFGRRLTDSGRADARRIGEWIAGSGLTLDRCLYSGAARARETFEIVSAAQRRPFESVQQNALYEATRFLILGLLRELPADARTTLIVAHNPGMADIANVLAGEGAASERLRLGSHFPTAALAVLAFDRLDWSDLSAGAGRLERFVTPSDV